MGAGYVNLRKKRKRQQRKVGRKEEGSSSNCPELAAFVLAFRGTPVTKYLLYLCDSSPAKSCKKMGRRRRKSDVSRSTRRRHFTTSGKDVPTEWHERINRAVFTWQERLYSMVHGWMRRASKRLVSGRRKKGETSTSLATVHG